MIVAKDPRSATPCIFEEEVEEEEVEVVTLPKHLPISSTSTTALREKVGLSNNTNIESLMSPEYEVFNLFSLSGHSCLCGQWGQSGDQS